MNRRTASLTLFLVALAVVPAIPSTAQVVPTCLGQQATLIGTAGPDVLSGTAGRDVIVGLGGNDVIRGGGGPDVICGNGGDDTIEGQQGRDFINGGAGDDLLIGGPRRDRMVGGSGADSLWGNGGTDLLRGWSGRDILRGGNGDDTIFGGKGIDQLWGERGSDVLYGGPNRDSCVGETKTHCEAIAGVGGTLTLVQWQGPWMLNPYLTASTRDILAGSLVLEPLAERTPEGELVPVLAEEVPTVANGGFAADFSSITWRLIDTVWSDGTPLTADDVVFTHDYCTDPATQCLAGQFSGVSSVEALNANTIKITFDEPTPYPYRSFVGDWSPILQRAQFEDCVGAAAQTCMAENTMPIGTGPYVITDLVEFESAAYVINPKYRGKAVGKPFFGEIALDGAPDAEAAARAVLEDGTADYAWALRRADQDLLSELEAIGIGAVYSSFDTRVEHINLNQTDPDGTPPSDYNDGANPNPFFFENEVLHDALSMAIDRSELVDAGYRFTGEPVCNMWNLHGQTSPNNDDCLSQDIAGANRLLDDNGYLDRDGDGIRETPGGTPLEFEYVTSTNTQRQGTQDLIEGYWAQIGVDVTMKDVDVAQFFDCLHDTCIWKFFTDMQMYSIGPSDADPGDYLGWWTTSEIPESTTNWVGANIVRLANEEYDALHSELLGIPGGDPRRDSIAISLNDIIVDYSTIPLFLWGDASAVAHTIEIHGGPNGWDSEYWNVEDWTRADLP